VTGSLYQNAVCGKFLLPLPYKIKLMNALFIPLAIGPWQIVLVVLVVLLLFGGRKIPELMRGLGSGIKEFKNATKEDEEDSSKIENKKD